MKRPSTSATTSTYNDVDGTLAAAHYFKKLAGQEPRMTYIELNGEGSIDSIRETLLSRLN